MFAQGDSGSLGALLKSRLKIDGARCEKICIGSVRLLQPCDQRSITVQDQHSDPNAQLRQYANFIKLARLELAHSRNFC